MGEIFLQYPNLSAQPPTIGKIYHQRSSGYEMRDPTRRRMKGKGQGIHLRCLLWNIPWILLLCVLPVFVGAFSTRCNKYFHLQTHGCGRDRNMHFRGRIIMKYDTSEVGGLVLQDNAPSKAPTQSGLPSWLAQHTGSQDLQNSSTHLLDKVQRNLSVLRSLLDKSRRFTITEVNDVMEALSLAADGDLAKLSGAAEFLWLLLSVEDCQPCDDEASTNDLAFECLMSRDSLIASVFHYCDCVSARNNGLYEIIEDAVTLSATPTLLENRLLNGLHLESDNFLTLGGCKISKTQDVITDDTEIRRGLNDGIERFGEDATRIAVSAARIKSTEVMADVVIGGKDIAPTREQSGSLQNLLVSVSEDWQSLAIRSVASLYRLRGIIAFREKLEGQSISHASSCEGVFDIKPVDSSIVQYKSLANDEGIKVSREALNIYAPIAQRLGMHRLKNELEGTAFRVLYPRQYSAAMSLYQNNVDKMRDVAQNIKDTINQIIHEDGILNMQTESIAIYYRVKEPYSLWRKLLKLRMRQLEVGESSKPSSTISISDVNDAIALRIIIKPSKLSIEESDESMNTRGKLLCYYMQKLCIDRWQVLDPTRVKDYITKPKANGYQSLHHTSQIFSHGLNLPFEVQIRSEDMHRAAEFGVAAHWDYKLQAKGIEALPLESGKNIALAVPSRSVNTKSKLADYLTSARARAMKVAPYLEALTNAREKMSQKNVYVFVSLSGTNNEGKLIPLSAGSSVHSAVLEYNSLHNVVSESEGEIVFLNGAPLSPKALRSTFLRNGDVISLLAMDNGDDQQ